MRARPWYLLLLVVAATATTGAPRDASADVQNNLVFRRQSGEVITFRAAAKSFAWCGPYDVGDVLTPTLHVITYDTTEVSHRYWRLWAIPADVVIGQPQLFPNHWTWPNPDSVEIYVADPSNEASTSTEDAAGSIVFQKLDCREGGDIEFTVDARIGSEFGDGPWITVQGSFRATLGTSPFPPPPAPTWGAVKAQYR